MTCYHGTMQVLGPHFFESQAKWIAQLLSGKKMLPSLEEMMKSIKELYHSREVANVPKRYTHSIADNDGFEVSAYIWWLIISDLVLLNLHAKVIK